MALDVDVVEVFQTDFIEVSVDNVTTIEVTPALNTVVEVTSDTVVVVESVQTTFIEVEVGIPGPPGPAGGGEEMKYDEQIDFVGEDVIYQGEAAPGSAVDAPVWRICKTTFVGEDLTKKWAAGAEFSVRWSDRYSLSY